MSPDPDRGPGRPLGLYRPARGQAVDDELAHHLAESADRLERAGLSRAAAEAEARRRFGDVRELRRRLVTMNGRGPGRETMRGLDEVWDALRGMARRPGPALGIMGLLTVAAAVALTTWTVVDGVLYRPPPFPEPERLVEVMAGPEPGGFLTPSLEWPVARRWAETDLWSVVGFNRRLDVIRTDRGAPESVSAQGMTPAAFRALGVTPARGRLFDEADARPGAPPVAVVPEVTARELRAAGPVLGAKLLLDDVSVEVVGVLPEGVRYPMAFGSAVFLPMADDGTVLGRSASRVEIVGRLSADLATASERVATLFAGFRESDPEAWTIRPAPIGEHRANADVRRTMLLVVGAVAFLYLVALVNGAHLLVIQAAGRLDEDAVRLSLGSSRARLRRGWWYRGALLSGVSVGAGWLAATILTGPAVALVPRSIAYMAPDALAPDGRVALLALGLWAVATATLAVLPAATLARLRPAGTVASSSSSRRSDGRAAVRLRNGLVAFQVALSLLLLSAGGVLARSYRTLVTADMGFDLDGVAYVGFTLPRDRYPEPADVWTAAERLRERVAGFPGVRSAAIADGAPARTGFSFGVRLEAEGREPLPEDPSLLLPMLRVDLHGVETFGLELVAGRAFEPGDAGTSRVLIDEPLARALWGDVAAGRRFRLDEDGPWYEVVGVIRDLRLHGPDDSTSPYDIVRLSSAEERPWSTYVVAATDGAPADLLPLLRAAAQEAHPGVPLQRIETARDALAESIHMERFTALMLMGLALAAVAVAILGLYGTVTYSVVRRLRELGIRVALGADAARIRRVVLRQGLATILIGTAVGLGAALLALRLLDIVVYGVPAVDPVALSGAAGFLVLTGVVACLPPARRAARTDPAEVLRSE